MDTKNVDLEIVESLNKYIEKVKEVYNIDSVILFGSYAKGTNDENSDIDVAIISSDFEDIYDVMAELMGLTWNLDTRIEPHPIKTQDFEEVSNPFIHEIIETGIKVA